MFSVHEQMNARTRSAIRETFIALVREHGFDQVKIRQIGEGASINRGTFYLHYLDKYDLMERIQDELLEGFRQKLIVPIDFEETYRHHLQRLPYAPFTEIFAYFVQHANLFELLGSKNGEAGFPLKLKKAVTLSFEKKLGNSRILERHPDVPSDYFNAYAASLLLGTVEAWLERARPETPEQLALIYNELMMIQRLIR
ncbi:TetR/AcrR family transcriptional regulator [Saccharibacillus brassicae]|uniref:TetR/AcrR family transcriptional regulator n=1 Tax=Saccharibacillus brassicae TaxID=2583377 RepID=A0A4Y6V2U5_SACBS|nr:TetR/AcrR family transcriptional regulator [Saccharibacillus brassicae]QDH23138.1 TetR/AcrR family transcriptional regulator [Saccharibacillus brassicae]